MKPLLTIILIFSFIGAAVFGFAMMPHNGEHDNGGCFMALAINGILCPQEGVLFDAVFHLDALKNFVGANIGGMLAISFLILAAAVFIAESNLARLAENLDSLFYALRRSLLNSLKSPFERLLTCWLAIHTNSPPIV